MLQKLQTVLCRVAICGVPRLLWVPVSAALVVSSLANCERDYYRRLQRSRKNH